MPAPKRHRNVPEGAEWIEEWKQWGVGARKGKHRVGPWRFFRKDGSLQEESTYVEGAIHGTSTRYHPNGAVAAKEERTMGRSTVTTLFPIRQTTDEQPAGLPPEATKVTLTFDTTGTRYAGITFFNAKGHVLTLRGKKAPPRPKGLPDPAYLDDDGTEWREGAFYGGKNFGFHRAWTLRGEPKRATYFHDDHGAIVLARPDPNLRAHGNPLIAAANAGDDRGVEAALAAGLGHEPGAALHAAVAGHAALARRISALPKRSQFGTHATPARPKVLPKDALWVPGLGAWVRGEVHPERGASSTIHVWKSGETVYEVAIHRFEAGLLRSTKVHSGADESGRVGEVRVYDAQGKLSRSRKLDVDETFEETEYLPSGESVTRYGGERVEREEHFAKTGELVSAVAFDESGRKRLDLDVAKKRGRMFDADGRTLGEGPVDEEGALVGTWKIGKSSVAVASWELGANADAADILPAIAALRPGTPKALARIPTPKWSKLEGFFELEPAQIERCLRLIALGEPFATAWGVNALADAMYHQGTITELTGPIAHRLVVLAAAMKTDAAREPILRFLSDVLSRGGDLDAAHAIKLAWRSRKSDAPKDARRAFADSEIEVEYAEILAALTAERANLTRWLSSADGDVAVFAATLLAFAEGEAAASALGRVLGSGAEIAEVAARSLSLFPREELPLAALRTALDATNERLQLEAALTLVRTGAEDARAIAVVLDALRKGDADAAVVSTLLPDAASHLASIVSLLARAPVTEVYGLARVALGLALETGTSRADKLGLRSVLEALLGNDAFWRLGVNASEVLGEFGLPTERDELAALVTGKRARPAKESRILSAASGLEGASVDTWRAQRALRLRQTSERAPRAPRR